MTKIIINRVEPTPINTLVNHTLVAGKSGSGKSNYCEFLLTQFLKQGKVKVIDLYDSGRFENMLYGFEETDPFLVKKIYHIAGMKPKAFKNQIIAIPGNELKYTNKLPNNVKLMSFNIKDLNMEDLYYLLGMSDKLEGFLALISNAYGDDINMQEIYEILTTGQLQGERKKIFIPDAIKGMIIRNIRRWLSSGMFSNELPKINFTEILKDTSTITSFSTFLLDGEESERMAYGLILKKINDIKRRRKVNNRVKVYVREMSVFFGDKWGMAKKYVLEYLRQGRDRGIDIICDMQRVYDIPSKYRRQFGLLVQLRTDFVEAEKLLDFQGDIPRWYLKKSPTWGAGEGILITGTSWEYPFLSPPTRHKHKKPGMNVLQLMADVHGWKEYSMEEIKDIMYFDIAEQQDKKIEEVKKDGELDL
jgi:hypothetical protein